MTEATSSAFAIGIDIGTSGVRAVALDRAGQTVATASHPFETPAEVRRPAAWWAGVEHCLGALRSATPLDGVAGLAVDGTSGTVLALDAAGAPIGDALLYNDRCTDPAALAAIAAAAPADSPALGGTSPLGKAIELAHRPGTVRILHQADWVASRLGDGIVVSDENNALKTGYDLQTESWPAWIAATGFDVGLLPPVRRVGTGLGAVGAAGRALGLPAAAIVHAGTTDGCASFLATGAREVGDGVTALGSTLVLKLLSDRPVFASDYGIYSHRIGDLWLPGGASNSGGAVLKALFGDAAIEALSASLDPDHPTGLDYYPLAAPGERFPVSDPAFPPRLEPRPADDARFFQGVLEGIAAIEALGYRRLAEHGAPALKSVRSVGGGARSAGWTKIRAARLGVPMREALSTDAAAGAARLVLANHALP
ncbi:FGGY-family carbohydrate kinase [Segnochrobactrum spirostomi]|uniref:FGGY-family carbohydrate kinase n=1 Tax=Segnochrobactrum spirostomi TaxID=2608987 RepID=A0A6A7Y9P5_9HYPH|nr:FGGY-family carbohydrate kinase [Segnochrobactrum spirostomi]MQT15087.1 FGGY-family carbohydrate kinase [Segnochrobactrum spirostomi]